MAKYRGGQTRTLPERSVRAALDAAPDNAINFVLYDSPEPDFDYDPKLFQVLPIPQNVSETYWLGGEVFSADELRAFPSPSTPNHRILIESLEGNDRLGIRLGKAPNHYWQFFEEGDHLVDPETAEVLR